ncbi:MAG: glycosyltransferase family 39 protein [Coriobacteriia bacterium]|nr:glycosyltransferase family 39 protein [Coriobacteriia bacterium]
MRTAARASRLAGVERVVVALVGLASVGLVVYRVAAAVASGPGWDTYAFLANAAEFAGKGYGYTELHRPPLLSALTALAFRGGAPLHESVIQWIDGALSASGVLALYLVFRTRFRPALSAVGALSALGVQPLWAYLGSGYTDFPSVALSLWVLWICMKATESDPRWYLLAGPLFVAATMTRYTALLAAFPVMVFLLLRWRPFYHAKHLLGAIALSAAAYLPAARLYQERFGDVLFPFILAFSVSENVSVQTDRSIASSTAVWYLQKLPAFLTGQRLAWLGVLALLLAAVGIVLGVGTYLQSRTPRPSRVATAVAACLPALLAQVGGGMVLRQLTIPIAVLGVWRALGPYDPDDETRRVTATAAVGASLVAWLLAYLDFHGHQTIQVARYLIPMLPGILFLMLYGFQAFFLDIHRTLAPHGAARSHAPRAGLMLVAPTLLAVLAAGALSAHVAETTWERSGINRAAEESARWLAQRPGIRDAVVFSDIWPLTAWYARTSVKPMPFFKSVEEMQHALDKSAVDYYVTIRNRAFSGYAAAATFGTARVLVRTQPAPRTLPRVLYLGKAWDNYLERVTGFDFYLDGDAGQYGWEGTAFLDAYGPKELAKWDAVAVYGVRWRSRAHGEAALLDYVRNGGSVVLDASANLGVMPYDLADTVVFDTVVRRAALPPDAQIRVGSTLVARDGRLSEVRAAPFVNETGGRWFGADYAPLPGSADLTVLATVDGRPAVAMRRIGRGRVYLIVYNLVWHAFITDNEDERALVRAVFADALASAAPSATPGAVDAQ